MAFTKLTADVANISKLDNYPPDDAGMTSAKLKGLFDQGGLTIKAYINDTLIPELEGGYIQSIARTAGSGLAGTEDTYTITYQDGETQTFSIYNGANGATGPIGATGATGPAGRNITSISRTSGNGAPGTTDTYTISFSDDTTQTFQIYNGADGATGGKGDKGDAGATGPAGLDGQSGALIPSGNGFMLQNGSTATPVLGGKAVNLAYITALDTGASGDYSHAEGYNTMASGDYSHAEGDRTKALGDYSHAEGYNTMASGDLSHAGGRSNTAKFCQTAIGQLGTISDASDTVYSATAEAFMIGNGTSTSARGLAFKVLFDGNTYADGAYSSTGADYAEFFEWADGNPDDEDRVGYIIALDGDKIRKATAGDVDILGIVSANPAIRGDNHEAWQGKYLTDDWGRIRYHEVAVPAEYTDTDGEQVEIAPDRVEYRPMLNPDWNPEQEYISREKRKEWAAVGMLGKLLVRDDGTAQINDYCRANDDGIATASDTGCRVLARKSDNIIMVLVR